MTRRRFWTSALALLALPVAAAQLDTNDLLRCHAIAANDQKLACYEALAVSAQSSATTAAGESAAAVGPAGVGATASGVTGPGGAISGAAASRVTALGNATASTSAPGAAGVGSPTSAAGAPASGAATNLNTEANFGLSRRQIEPQAQAQGPASIKSAVSEITENRQHHITVVLDNGQTWAFIEPEPRLRPGDAVTIKHASLGSFLMLTPNHRSYRVERLK